MFQIGWMCRISCHGQYSFDQAADVPHGDILPDKFKLWLSGAAQALTEATVRTLGGSPGSVDIIFVDVQRHDWATGGTLWSDAAPGPAPAAPPLPAGNAAGGRP